MEIIGKNTIHPIFFFSGKILGYCTWIALVLFLLNIDLISHKNMIYNEYISFVFLIIGIVLSVFSLINLGKSTRFGLPIEKTVFKSNGLYRISRNPMYVGFDLLTLSSMVYSLNIWIILIGIYSIAIYHFIILGEEKFLESRFGEEYKNYKTKVRRYL